MEFGAQGVGRNCSVFTWTGRWRPTETQQIKAVSQCFIRSDGLHNWAALCLSPHANRLRQLLVQHLTLSSPPCKVGLIRRITAAAAAHWAGKLLLAAKPSSSQPDFGWKLWFVLRLLLTLVRWSDGARLRTCVENECTERRRVHDGEEMSSHFQTIQVRARSQAEHVEPCSCLCVQQFPGVSCGAVGLFSAAWRKFYEIKIK